MEPPYHPRLDRPVLSAVGEPAVVAGDSDAGSAVTVALGAEQTRAAAKKAFDAQVFQTTYF